MSLAVCDLLLVPRHLGSVSFLPLGSLSLECEELESQSDESFMEENFEAHVT